MLTFNDRCEGEEEYNNKQSLVRGGVHEGWEARRSVITPTASGSGKSGIILGRMGK